MKSKEISSRELRRGAPEETLRPGEGLTIKKGNGKRFKLTRVDPGERSISHALDKLFAEIPLEGPPVRIDGAKAIIEDRV